MPRHKDVGLSTEPLLRDHFDKNRFMGPELIWPNIIIAVNATLARVRHVVSSKQVTLQTQM